MNWIFYAVYITWFLSEIFIHRLLPAADDKKGKDRRSLGIIWATLIIAINLGGFLSFNTYHPIMQNEYVRYAGLCIIVAGMLFRLYCVRMLGKYFTVQITVKDDHKLIDTGVYKYLRHPSYTGSLLSFIGLGVSMNNWLSLLVIFIPVFIAFQYRIRLEEKMLEESIKGYTDYKKRTWRLIPYLF